MAFCAYCGHQIPDGNEYCPTCGRLVKVSSVHVEKGDRFGKFYDESYYSLDSDKKKSKKKPKETTPAYNTVPTENVTPTYNNEPVNNSQPTYNTLPVNNNPQIIGYVPQEKYGTLFISIFLLLLSLTGCCYGIPIVTIIVTSAVILVSMLGLIKFKFKGTVLLILAIVFSTLALLGGIAYGQKWGFFQFRHSEDGRDPVLGDVGVYVVPSSDDNRKTTVYYYYELINTDDTFVLIDQGVKLEFLNSSGKKVGMEIPHTSYVLPEDTVYCFGIESMYSGRLEECVDVDATLYRTSFARFDYLNSPIRSTDIEISDVSLTEEKQSQNITGVITNNSAFKLEDPTVFVVFKLDDEVVAIDYTELGNISPGATEDFTIKIYNYLPEYDTFECYVDVWSE